MMTTKNESNHSSEIGLVGDIIPACLATVAKLLKCRGSSGTNSQARLDASDADRRNNDDDGQCSDPLEKLSTGHLGAETELSDPFGDTVEQFRLWADPEGWLDKTLERDTQVKIALFTGFISMTRLLARGSISQPQTAVTSS
jgi:hypothetical protein